MGSTVHIAVDVQEEFCAKLKPCDAAKFPRKIAAFAETLRKRGIPTLWVALKPGACELRSPGSFHSAFSEDHASFVKKHGLVAVNPPTAETIFVKGGDNAFAVPVLGDYLKQRGIDTLIVSGMNTRACLSKTLSGALDRDFTVTAATDMLADREASQAQNASPAWHQAALEELLGEETGTNSPIRYKESAVLLSNLLIAQCTKPRHPARIRGQSGLQVPANV